MASQLRVAILGSISLAPPPLLLQILDLIESINR